MPSARSVPRWGVLDGDFPGRRALVLGDEVMQHHARINEERAVPELAFQTVAKGHKSRLHSPKVVLNPGAHGGMLKVEEVFGPRGG